jgi:hypothetical protein
MFCPSTFPTTHLALDALYDFSKIKFPKDAWPAFPVLHPCVASKSVSGTDDFAPRAIIHDAYYSPDAIVAAINQKIPTHGEALFGVLFEGDAREVSVDDVRLAIFNLSKKLDADCALTHVY